MSSGSSAYQRPRTDSSFEPARLRARPSFPYWFWNGQRIPAKGLSPPP
jgi:hypothetical protein